MYSNCPLEETVKTLEVLFGSEPVHLETAFRAFVNKKRVFFGEFPQTNVSVLRMNAWETIKPT